MKKGHGLVPMAFLYPFGEFGLWAAPRPKKAKVKMKIRECSLSHCCIFPITRHAVKTFLDACISPDPWDTEPLMFGNAKDDGNSIRSG
jgi:hypothetical protein